MKVADNWSWKKVVEALRDQLIGRYLRHEGCRAGVLPPIPVGLKKRWVMPDGTRIPFADLIRRLMVEAEAIMRDHPDLRVMVVGIVLGACRGGDGSQTAARASR